MTVKEIERLIFITREIERMKTDIYYLSNEYEAFLYPFRAAFHHLYLVGTFVYDGLIFLGCYLCASLLERKN